MNTDQLLSHAKKLLASTTKMKNLEIAPREALIETFETLARLLHPCDRLFSLCEEIIKALQENRISDAQYFILEAEPDLIKIQELINTSK